MSSPKFVPLFLSNHIMFLSIFLQRFQMGVQKSSLFQGWQPAGWPPWVCVGCLQSRTKWQLKVLYREEVQKSTKEFNLRECWGNVRSVLEASGLVCHSSTTARREPQSLIIGEGLCSPNQKYYCDRSGLMAKVWSHHTALTIILGMQSKWHDVASSARDPLPKSDIQGPYIAVFLQSAFSGGTAIFQSSYLRIFSL